MGCTWRLGEDSRMWFAGLESVEIGLGRLALSFSQRGGFCVAGLWR
jgi:hypothetical protein